MDRLEELPPRTPDPWARAPTTVVGRVEQPEALEEGTQPPDFPEDGWSKETEAVALKAAQNVAMALAVRGEEGFRAVADPKNIFLQIGSMTGPCLRRHCTDWRS